MTHHKQYQLEKNIEHSLMDNENRVKRLGLIAYFRKLFGNFQRNVRRKAFFIGRRRTSIVTSTGGGDIIPPNKLLSPTITTNQKGDDRKQVEMMEIQVKMSKK